MASRWLRSATPAEAQELYLRASQRGRQVLNQALFAKVFCDADDNGPYVAADELSDLVLSLVTEARNESGGTDGAAAGDLLTPAAAGSSKPSLVEVPGIEPGSFGVLSGLLRAQLTMPLLGPTNHMSKLV